METPAQVHKTTACYTKFLLTEDDSLLTFAVEAD
jgi:hypothetical protein